MTSSTSTSSSGRTTKCSSRNFSQGLVVTLWDARSETYLRFPQTQRIHSWTSVVELKKKVTEELGYPVESQRLYMRNQELQDEQEVKDLADSTPLAPSPISIIVVSRHQTTSVKELNQIIPTTAPAVTSINVFGTVPVGEDMNRTMAAIDAGFREGLEPSLTEEGTSGAYLLRRTEKESLDGSRPVAVWKPIDEEPFAPNNPRGMQAPFGSETCRPGVKSGESSLREVMAYLLDHEGFAGVPPTALVEVSHPSLKLNQVSDHEVASDQFRNLISGLLRFKKKPSNLPTAGSPESSPRSSLSTRSSPCSPQSESYPANEPLPEKVGSLQLFVSSEGPIENFSPSLFAVDEIHKIAVLDLRILNLDRNACNILVQRTQCEVSGQSKLRLVPIDHGLTIPDSLAIQSFDLAWLDFEQASKPFSEKTLDYVARLDPDHDIRYLEKNFKVRPECLRNMKISTLLLKRAAAKGLNLAQIGQILCRPDDDEDVPSLLEKIVDKARLCANLRLQLQSKFKDSMLLISQKDTLQVPTATKAHHSDKTQDKPLDGKRPTPLKRIPKNNSFNEKNSSIQQAMKDSLRAEAEECDSPSFRRARGMTEGADEHQINLLNANAKGMIQQNIHQLRKQQESTVSKKTAKAYQQLAFHDDPFFRMGGDEPSSPGLNLDLLRNTSSSEQEEEIKKSVVMEMRRAVSYCQPQTCYAQVEELPTDQPRLVHHRSTTHTGKHRRLMQAKQAYIKYQESEMSSTTNSFKQQRALVTAQKRLTHGGPHDQEFFRCFEIYLAETLTLFASGQTHANLVL